MVLGGVVVADVDVEMGRTDVVVVVTSAAGMVEELTAVDSGTVVLVARAGESVLVTDCSPLARSARSTGTADALTVSPERFAEATDEPHAAVPITANTSTAICSLFNRLTLWLRQRLSPTEEGPVIARS